MRGTRKDGAPRVFEGRKPKVRPVELGDYLLGVDHAPVDRLGDVLPQAGVRSLANGLQAWIDRFDADLEDRWGRLPHEPGFGVPPLAAVPDPAPSTDVREDIAA